MSGQAVEVQITGLTELRAALKAADAKLPSELRKAMNVITDEIVAPSVIHMMVEQFLTPRDERKGLLQRAVKGSSTSKFGQVKEGSNSVPYAGWWEYGGSTGTSRGTGDREYLKEGRALYPAVVKNAPEIYLAMDHVIEQLASLIDAEG